MANAKHRAGGGNVKVSPIKESHLIKKVECKNIKRIVVYKIPITFRQGVIIQRYFHCICSSILNVDKLWWWCKRNMGMKWIYLIIYHNFSSSKIINLVSNSFVDHLRTWITHVGISTMSNMIPFLTCTQSKETVVWSLYLQHMITVFRD